MAYGSFALNNVAAAFTTSPKTILQIGGVAAHAADILEASVGQSNYLTSSMQAVGVISCTGAATGGTSATPVGLNAGGAASAYVGGAALSCYGPSAEGTTITEYVQEVFNTLSSWRYEPVPERRPRFVGAVFPAVRLETAPAASITVTAQIVWLELF